MIMLNIFRHFRIFLLFDYLTGKMEMTNYASTALCFFLPG